MNKDRMFGLGKGNFFKLIDVFKQYVEFIEHVILFGSRARGDFKPTSDIDLAIKFRNSGEQMFNIIDDLSHENIIYTFDVVDYDKISNEKLKNYIDSEGIVIFQTNSHGKVISSMNKVRDKLLDLERAFKKLEQSLERDPGQDDLVIDATIQRFEFTYELSWKLMKVYLEFNGNLEATSPRRTIKEAFKDKLITEGDSWLKMLEDRNKTSHTYDEETALDIYKNIKEVYIENINSLIDEVKKRINSDGE